MSLLRFFVLVFELFKSFPPWIRGFLAPFVFHGDGGIAFRRDPPAIFGAERLHGHRKQDLVENKRRQIYLSARIVKEKVHFIVGQHGAAGRAAPFLHNEPEFTAYRLPNRCKTTRAFQLHHALIPHPRMHLRLESVEIGNAGNGPFQNKALSIVAAHGHVLRKNAVSFRNPAYLDFHNSKALKIIRKAENSQGNNEGIKSRRKEKNRAVTFPSAWAK